MENNRDNKFIDLNCLYMKVLIIRLSELFYFVLLPVSNWTDILELTSAVLFGKNQRRLETVCFPWEHVSALRLQFEPPGNSVLSRFSIGFLLVEPSSSSVHRAERLTVVQAEKGSTVQERLGRREWWWEIGKQHTKTCTVSGISVLLS